MDRDVANSSVPKVIGSRSVDKPELIRAIREAHQRIAGALENTDDSRLLEPAMGDWTGKDLLAHLASWHDHSVLVIETLRAGGQPDDDTDAADDTDVLNERTHREHIDDPPELTRKAFNESFVRLLAAIELLTDAELFADDHWPWPEGEALAEMVQWDSSSHYDAHQKSFDALSR
jgi:hypothetical protein